MQEKPEAQNPSLNEPVDPKIVFESFDDDTKVKGEVFMCQVEKGEDLTKVRAHEQNPNPIGTTGFCERVEVMNHV